MPTPALRTLREWLVAIALVILAGAVAGAFMLAVYEVTWHNVRRQERQCSRRGLAPAPTGDYEDPKCFDPKTGIIYQPEAVPFKKP